MISIWGIEGDDREGTRGCKDVEEEPKQPAMEGYREKSKGEAKEERPNKQCVSCSPNITLLLFLSSGEEETADPIIESIVERKSEKGGDDIDQKCNSTTIMSTVNLHVGPFCKYCTSEGDQSNELRKLSTILHAS